MVSSSFATKTQFEQSEDVKESPSFTEQKLIRNPMFHMEQKSESNLLHRGCSPNKNIKLLGGIPYTTHGEQIPSPPVLLS